MMLEQRHQEEQRAAEVQEPTPAPQVEIDVRSWLDTRTQGPVLLQLWLTSKYQSQLQFEVQVSNASPEANVILPQTMMQETVFGFDQKAIAHFMKVDPEQPFGGEFKIIVQNNWQAPTETTNNQMQVVPYEATSPDYTPQDDYNVYNTDGGYVPEGGVLAHQDSNQYWTSDGADGG
jgi:hypothetical protein